MRRSRICWPTSAPSATRSRSRWRARLRLAANKRGYSMRYFALLFALALSCADLRAGELKAGAFAQDVTPEKFPVSVNGGFSDRKATSANDPLHARCLVLDDGKTKLALVVVDSCML